MSSAPMIASFVNGHTLAHEGGGFPLVRPQDGAAIGTIAEAGAKGVAAAVAGAQEAFRAQRRAPLHQRIGWLKAAAGALGGTAEEIAQIICEDVGKPIRIARFEAKRGVNFIESCMAAAAQIGGEVLPVDAAVAGTGHIGFTRRVPYGVVAGITPFNAPVNLLIQKVAPAIAAGNAIVVKPAPAGMRTAVNAAFAAMCPLGAVVFLLGVERFSGDQATAVGCALAFAAGLFICISLSDLLPEIEFHSHDRLRLSLALLAGVGLAYAIGAIEPAHSHEGGHGAPRMTKFQSAGVPMLFLPDRR